MNTVMLYDFFFNFQYLQKKKRISRFSLNRFCKILLLSGTTVVFMHSIITQYIAFDEMFDFQI